MSLIKIIGIGFIIGITDRRSPVVEYCPDNIVKPLYDGSLRTQITWTEPIFSDNIRIFDLKQTHNSGKLI